MLEFIPYVFGVAMSTSLPATTQPTPLALQYFQTSQSEKPMPVDVHPHAPFQCDNPEILDRLAHALSAGSPPTEESSTSINGLGFFFNIINESYDSVNKQRDCYASIETTTQTTRSGSTIHYRIQLINKRMQLDVIE